VAAVDECILKRNPIQQCLAIVQLHRSQLHARIVIGATRARQPAVLHYCLRRAYSWLRRFLLRSGRRWSIYQGTLPDQAYKYGRFYSVPLLVDRDGYEGYIFTQPNITTSQAIETVDSQILFPFARLYPASDFNSTFWQRATWFGDFIINGLARFLNSFDFLANGQVRPITWPPQRSIVRIRRL
jgi:hypothetical protein